MYAFKNGSTWITVTVDSEGYVGKYSSIALDSDGTPHISYMEELDGGLKYAKWSGDSWIIQVVDAAHDVGMPSSIALDKTGNPHISYFDLAKGDLKYAKWNGSAWDIQTVDSSGYVGSDNSIALDSLGRPHISYRAGEPGYSFLKYAYWNSSSWDIGTVESGDVVSDTSIALDSQDSPHISYYDLSSGHLKYVEKSGSGWSIQTVDSNGKVGAYDSLALDSNDNPHINYCDMTDGLFNYVLKYAQKVGSSWETQTVDAGGDVGKYTSLAIDSQNNPHISYYNETGAYLKYASIESPNPTPSSSPRTEPPEIQILSPESIEFEASQIPLTFTVDKQASWMGYSLDGQNNVTVTGNSTLTNLALGFHSLIIYANDTEGNMGKSNETSTMVLLIEPTPPPTTTPPGFLGTSLPIEYGYAIVAVLGIIIVAGLSLVYFKKLRK
jgi:hypothetical protein